MLCENWRGLESAIMGIQVNTLKGDSMEGMAACPGAPLGYVAEGGLMSQYNPEKFPNQLAGKGITDETWAAICKSLADGKGFTGFGGGFSKAIKKANEDHFDKCGLEATYAEYAKGQKCMIVYAKGTVPK